MHLNKHTFKWESVSYAPTTRTALVPRLGVQARETRLGVPACSLFSIKIEGHQEASVRAPPEVPVTAQVQHCQC